MPISFFKRLVGKVDDMLAPDTAGGKKTFSGNFKQIANEGNFAQDTRKAVGTNLVNSNIGRNVITPFITGAAQPTLGIAGLFNKDVNRFALDQRKTVNDHANLKISNKVPLLGGQNPFMLAGEMAADPTSYIPLIKGASLLNKAKIGAGVGATSGFIQPAEDMQNRLTNSALGGVFGGALPVGTHYAGKGIQAGARGAQQGVIKFAEANPQLVSQLADQRGSINTDLLTGGLNSKMANKQKVQITNPGKERGLIKSLKNSDKISAETKVQLEGRYIPKKNQQLMGEAQALLAEGGSFDIKKTQDLDKKVAATIQEALNLQKAGDHQAAANLYNNLSTHATELGRSVQAFRLLQQMTPESISLSVASKIRKYNQTAKNKIPELTGEQSQQLADKITQIDSLTGRERGIAVGELHQMINSYIPSSVVDKALTVWKAGLLTSPRTHMRNVVGNSLHGGMEILKDIPAAAADRMMAQKTGQRTLAFTTDGAGRLGDKATRQEMADLMKLGFNPNDDLNKWDVRQVNWDKTPVQQALKKYTDVVFRSLQASDRPFYHFAYARSLYSQAKAQAMNAGKNGDTAFIKNLVDNPDEGMITNAVKDATTATFQNETRARDLVGSLKKNISQSSEAGKVIGELTMPFTGVPTSILGQIVDYSPIGLAKGIKNATQVTAENAGELQRKAAQEIGRGTMGTGVFALGAFLTQQGLMTGQPKDQAEARQWELENKPRNSIMIGGKWRSLNSIGPETVVMLAGSKLNELFGGEGDIGTWAASLGADFLDQSFVQGLQAPVNAITDPARFGKSYLGQTLSSPIPNIIKDVAKAMDSTARETNGVLDYVKAGVPGLRNTLTERRDVLGNIIKQEPSGAAAFVDLFNSKTPISGEVVDELSRLNKEGFNATPSKLSKNFSKDGQKQTRTPDELNQLEQTSGVWVQKALSELINSEEYKVLNDEEKQAEVEKVTKSARAFSKEQVSNPNATPTEATYAQTKELAFLRSKFKTVDDKSAFGKAKNKKSQETAIKAVYNSYLEGNITEEQAVQLFDEFEIDPAVAEYTYADSLDNEDKAPWVFENIKEYGEPAIQTLLERGMLTTSLTKEMLGQGLIDAGQKKYLDTLIKGYGNTKYGTGSTKTAKAKQVRISVPKSSYSAPKMVSIKLSSNGAPRVPAPKFAKITA